MPWCWGKDFTTFDKGVKSPLISHWTGMNLSLLPCGWFFSFISIEPIYFCSQIRGLAWPAILVGWVAQSARCPTFLFVQLLFRAEQEFQSQKCSFIGFFKKQKKQWCLNACCGNAILYTVLLFMLYFNAFLFALLVCNKWRSGLLDLSDATFLISVY